MKQSEKNFDLPDETPYEERSWYGWYPEDAEEPEPDVPVTSLLLQRPLRPQLLTLEMALWERHRRNDDLVDHQATDRLVFQAPLLLLNLNKVVMRSMSSPWPTALCLEYYVASGSCSQLDCQLMRKETFCLPPKAAWSSP